MTSRTLSQIKMLHHIRSIPVPVGDDVLLIPVNIGRKTNDTIQQLSSEYGCDRTKLIRYLIEQGLKALQPTDSNEQPALHGSSVE
jgi:hypothetical protein